MIIDKAKGDPHPIPHEPGQIMNIRHLTHGEVKEARDVMSQATSKTAMDLMSHLSPEAIAGLKNEQRDKAEDPASTYDRGIVLGYAIVGWTYPQTVEEGLPNLDEKTAAWAFKTAAKMFTGDAEEGEG